MKRKTLGKPEDQLTLGARVRWARESAGLGQTRLGQLIGLSQPAISMIENDETQSTAQTPEIAHHCNVDALWLVRGGPSPRSDRTPPPPTREDAEALQEFGLRVRRIRTRRGLSESAMARGIMEAADWRAMEAGRLLPGPVALDLMSGKLNTSLDWLIRGMTKDEIPSVAPDKDLVRRVRDSSSAPMISD